MAIAFVQKKEGALATNASSITVTFDSTPTEGNLMILALSLRSSGDGIILPSGWTKQIDNTGNTTLAMGWKIAGAGESSDVLVSYDDTTGSALIIGEFSGIDGTPFDVSQTGSGGPVKASTAGPTASTAQNDELAVAATAVRQDGGAWVSWSDSFITGDDIVSTSASVAHIAWCYKILTAIGTPQVTGTWTNNQDFVDGILTFKAAAVSAAKRRRVGIGAGYAMRR